VASISAKTRNPIVLEQNNRFWNLSTPSAKPLRVYFAEAERLEPAPVNSSAEMPSGVTVIWREPPRPASAWRSE
jgi:hypothetical protein